MFSRSLMPFSPSRGLRQQQDPFVDLHREMNRLFDDFMGGTLPQQGGPAMPRLDVREADKEICVCAELPGVDPSQVDVRLDGSVLTISGEKRNDSERDDDNYHVMERSFGRFQRSIQLPFEPQAQDLRADFKHGLLTVHVPKQAQQERSRKIDIQVADGEGGQPAGGAMANGPTADQGADVKH